MIKQVLDWYWNRFPERRKWNRKKHAGHLIKKLVEEVGELSETYISTDISLRDRKYEIADILIVVYAIADHEGIDIDKAVKDKLRVIKRRTKKY